MSDGARTPRSATCRCPARTTAPSGVALFVGIGDALKKTPATVGVDLLFVDGEDYGDFGAMKDVLLGSKYFASHLPSPDYKPLYGVLWDMIGDKDLDIYQEPTSLQRAPEVVSLVWNEAQTLGYSRYFINSPMTLGRHRRSHSAARRRDPHDRRDRLRLSLAPHARRHLRQDLRALAPGSGRCGDRAGDVEIVLARTRSINDRAGARPRDLRACPLQPKSAPSSFSPPCSRSAPACAQRRRSAPNRRRSVRPRAPIFTARSSPWTPRIPLSASAEGSTIGRSDRKRWESRHPMAPMRPHVRTRALLLSDGSAQSFRCPVPVSRTTSVQLPADQSIWTELRSGRSSRFPKVGPALAHRILADRDSLGPFGSLDELRRVKGVGDGIINAITPYVTFSLSTASIP